MYAIWLLFDKKDNNYLYNLIQELSKQYKSTVFLPHITAYGLTEMSLNTIEKIVLKSIDDVTPFFVKKTRINYSNDFWKTLFIEIKNNAYLNQINKKLTKEFSKFKKFEFLPHVSLIYKKMNEEKKKNLANNLVIKDSFLISKIGILNFSENITEWKIIKEYKLMN